MERYIPTGGYYLHITDMRRSENDEDILKQHSPVSY